MLIVIDFGSDEDDIIETIDRSKAGADDEARRKAEWLEWLKREQQVIPQITPVEQS